MSPLVWLAGLVYLVVDWWRRSRRAPAPAPLGDEERGGAWLPPHDGAMIEDYYISG